MKIFASTVRAQAVAVGLPTLVIGMGLGFFTAVTLARADPTGEVMRTYFGVVTALMGGALGFLTARVNDRIVDARRLARRKNLNFVQIDNLRYALGWVGEPTKDTPRDHFQAVVDRVKLTGSIAPNFEDMIDTEDDLKQAARIIGIFQATQWWSDVRNCDLGQSQKEFGAWAESSIGRGFSAWASGSYKMLGEGLDHFNPGVVRSSEQ